MDWQFVGRDEELDALVRSIGEGRSVLLTGPAGVGKSRLSEEAGAALEATHHVERLIGSPSVHELPFGAVAHLAGDAPLPEPAVLIRFITKAMRRRAERRPIAVVVDDINQLDDGSLGFVENLLAHEEIPVLATARTEGAGDRRIVQLWKDNLIERQELQTLSRALTDQLVEAILGGQATTRLTNEIWRLTEGHPLFVRELLLEGMDQETLVTDADGLWELRGSLGRSQRVADIVELRTTHLEAAEVEGLRAIALCEPTRLELANRFTTRAVLEALEAKRMIRLDSTPEGPMIRTSHPLIGEVTVGQTPPLARAGTTARLAHVLLDAPATTFQDAMRASMWLMEAGEIPPQHAAINGARAALRSFDPKLAQRLAEAALRSGSSQEATVLLGRAHAASGEAPTAVTLLQDAQQTAQSESELAAATTAIAEVHMFSLGDAERAVRELEKALETMEEAGPRAEINSHLMMAVGVTGDFDLGLRIGPEVADRSDLPEPAQLNSVMAMTLTQTMTGKLGGIEERLSRGEALAARFSDFQPFAPDQVGLNRLLALQAQADLGGADAFAESSIKRGVGLPGPWFFNRAVTHQFTGDVAAARSLAAQSVTQLRDSDPLGLAPMAHAIHGLFEAMGGRLDEAGRLVEETRLDLRSVAPRNAVWLDRTEAWITANRGALDDAAQRALAAGSAAIRGTHHVWGSYAFHDAVRFDRPEVVSGALAELNGQDRGPLVALLADHAAAAAQRHVEDLERVARRYREIGAVALAGECHAVLASITDGSVHARHSHLADHARRSCAGLVSPLLEKTEPPLSERQREIAELASHGLSSRDIADGLHLSVRTVDNHLRSVYEILSISGRTELPALFPG